MEAQNQCIQNKSAGILSWLRRNRQEFTFSNAELEIVRSYQFIGLIF